MIIIFPIHRVEMSKTTITQPEGECVIRPLRGIRLQTQIDQVIKKGVRKVVLQGTFTSGRGNQFSLLTISQDIEILGKGKAILDGEDRLTHLLFIADNVKLKVKGVRFRRGNTYDKNSQTSLENHPGTRLNIFRYLDGGAISMGKGSEIVLENCDFDNNHSAICGGAISNLGGYLYVRNCTFQNNTCGDTGAAIDNLASGCITVIENCTFIHNRANKSGAGNYGAVTAFPNTYLVVRNSDFSKESETTLDYRPNATGSSCVFLDKKTIFNRKVTSPIVTTLHSNSGVWKEIFSRYIQLFIKHPFLVTFEGVPKGERGISEKHKRIYYHRIQNQRNKLEIPTQ